MQIKIILFKQIKSKNKHIKNKINKYHKHKNQITRLKIGQKN